MPLAAIGRLLVGSVAGQLPDPRFIKRLGSSLYMVQIASYEGKQKHRREDYIKLNKFTMFHYVVNRLRPVTKGRPNSTVSNFSHVFKLSTWLQSHDRTTNLIK